MQVQWFSGGPAGCNTYIAKALRLLPPRRACPCAPPATAPNPEACPEATTSHVGTTFPNLFVFLRVRMKFKSSPVSHFNRASKQASRRHFTIVKQSTLVLFLLLKCQNNRLRLIWLIWLIWSTCHRPSYPLLYIVVTTVLDTYHNSCVYSVLLYSLCRVQNTVKFTSRSSRPFESILNRRQGLIWIFLILFI